VVGGEDGSIGIWEGGPAGWRAVSQARFHKKCIRDVAVGGDGRVILSAGGDKIVVWGSSNLKKAHEYRLGKPGEIERIKVTDDLKTIYYSESTGQLSKISTDNNDDRVLLQVPPQRKIQDFLIQSEFIIVGNEVGEVMAWQLKCF
jgi:WD40 repeat protein